MERKRIYRSAETLPIESERVYIGPERVPRCFELLDI
jgi:hypothetical protein